jgi:hypothetical protein
MTADVVEEVDKEFDCFSGVDIGGGETAWQCGQDRAEDMHEDCPL